MTVFLPIPAIRDAKIKGFHQAGAVVVTTGWRWEGSGSSAIGSVGETIVAGDVR